jgi:hypothetical protein
VCILYSQDQLVHMLNNYTIMDLLPGCPSQPLTSYQTLRKSTIYKNVETHKIIHTPEWQKLECRRMCREQLISILYIYTIVELQLAKWNSCEAQKKVMPNRNTKEMRISSTNWKLNQWWIDYIQEYWRKLKEHVNRKNPKMNFMLSAKRQRSVPCPMKKWEENTRS